MQRPRGQAPVCARQARLHQHRLDRRLQLKAPRLLEPTGRPQGFLSLACHLQIPERRVLLGQRHIAAIHPPRGAAAFAKQHQRQKSQRLGVRWPQLYQHPRQPDRLFGQPLARLVVAACAVPALPIGGIDGLEHIAHALAQLVFARHFEGNPCVLDARLGTAQPPPHRIGRNQKRRRDTLRRQPEHCLQHQRRARGGINCLVTAHEHQFQPLVGNLGHALAFRPR